ncbi:MAG: DUF501 domain-containing protein [Actinomycetaceae bacterium]|nr:DUF501 domain-containing protein [Actinomycetaceae bacterium]
MPITPACDTDITIIKSQLGRLPRGVEGVAARCKCGAPLVVFTAPRLPDGSPFPTCFYLTQPAAVKGCSTLEAEKWMDDLNRILGEDPLLASKYRQAHTHYIQARETMGKVEEICDVSAGGMPTRVKCLHAVLGHSLAAGVGVNPIGDLVVDKLAERDLWDQETCRCEVGQRPEDVAAAEAQQHAEAHPDGPVA